MSRMSGWTLAAVVLALGVGVACAPKQKQVEPAPPEPAPAAVEPAPAAPAPAVAHANIQSAKGVGGTVTFTEQGGTVTVEARLTGVGAGEHGFHVHETGDCSAPDFTSAGGHFNPTGAPHGAPADAAHHAGDLGNITIAADGTGSLTLSSSMLTVSPGPNSVVGKGVIVHEKADDLKTQPTGDAGGRIGCGVVEAGAAPAPAAS
jgi:superoxide dismutase, Cu-Zn family